MDKEYKSTPIKVLTIIAQVRILAALIFHISKSLFWQSSDLKKSVVG